MWKMGKKTRLFSMIIVAGSRTQNGRNPKGNIHATVKPPSQQETDIGSGTTAISSILLKRRFIGFEKEQEYWNIANERIKFYQKQEML